MSEQLTKALREWAERNQINPTEFAKAMGYTYAHAHGLLRGERKATMETLGRLLLVYGAVEAEWISAATRETLAQSNLAVTQMYVEGNLSLAPGHSPDGRGGEEAEDLLAQG